MLVHGKEVDGMSDMTLQAVERKRKRRDRWMTGNAAELLRRGAAVAALVLPMALQNLINVGVSSADVIMLG